MNKGPQVSAAMAAAIVCLAVGAAAGYYGRYMTEQSPGGGSSGARGGSGGMGGGMRSGGMGGMGGGMGGMMGAGNQPQNGMALARTVRNLSMVQKAQSHGLTAQQAASLAPILDSLKSTETLPDKDAEAKLAEVNKVLTDDQKKILEEMAPPRGGFGGGGGMGGGGRMGSGGGMASGAPMPPGGPGGPAGPRPSGGMGAMMGGMGGGGGRPDPEKPFANERNKQALEDLIAATKKSGGTASH